MFNGSVYMGVSSFFGGLNNCPYVQGQLVQLNATTGVVENTMNTVPDGCTGASVWASPTVDEASGTVYFATGSPGTCSTAEPYAEAVIEVSASDLSLIGSWQVPPSQQISDSDFGATPILFTSTQQGVTQGMVGAVNKNGIYYAFSATTSPPDPTGKTKLLSAARTPQADRAASLLEPGTAPTSTSRAGVPPSTE